MSRLPVTFLVRFTKGLMTHEVMSAESQHSWQKLLVSASKVLGATNMDSFAADVLLRDGQICLLAPVKGFIRGHGHLFQKSKSSSEAKLVP
ncbi:hypothetical protein NDU88_003138 [Pleurodeles waltl]|uniref:Uncharacterized protein n=1 Tax=Pleurodeles waltl TaxID=8319 RepID=A0AAV7UZ76_PLEWA|nr:hypothetical protein NDU88_003138 [Pleurodeles waltl]